MFICVQVYHNVHAVRTGTRPQGSVTVQRPVHCNVAQTGVWVYNHARPRTYPASLVTIKAGTAHNPQPHARALQEASFAQTHVLNGMRDARNRCAFHRSCSSALLRTSFATVLATSS